MIRKKEGKEDRKKIITFFYKKQHKLALIDPRILAFTV
jgi:hypothetical protein